MIVQYHGTVMYKHPTARNTQSQTGQFPPVPALCVERTAVLFWSLQDLQEHRRDPRLVTTDAAHTCRPRPTRTNRTADAIGGDAPLYAWRGTCTQAVDCADSHSLPHAPDRLVPVVFPTIVNFSRSLAHMRHNPRRLVAYEDDAGECREGSAGWFCT